MVGLSASFLEFLIRWMIPILCTVSLLSFIAHAASGFSCMLDCTKGCMDVWMCRCSYGCVAISVRLLRLYVWELRGNWFLILVVNSFVVFDISYRPCYRDREVMGMLCMYLKQPPMHLLRPQSSPSSSSSSSLPPSALLNQAGFFDQGYFVPSVLSSLNATS